MIPFRVVRYNPPAYRPAISQTRSTRDMGALASMTVGDWLLLAGSAIVGGAGVNGLAHQVIGPQRNAISILFDIVLVAVGGTVFVQKFGKMTG